MFDAPPEAFGSYRVLDEIGGGRFGQIYRARDAASGELVAIKVFDQGLTAERAASLAQALDRLCRAPLDHPVIVPRLVAGTLDHRAWLAEPWLEKMLPLDYVMRHAGAQPLGDVLLRLTQVAGALDFAAAAGIFHGALHPRDILVSDERTLLTGIGVLQALGEAGLDLPMTGAYVSPQRAAGEPPAVSDDIFALAAITYELVYGRPVPERAELRASMTRLTGVNHTHFVELLERALSPDADDRPATALALAGALQQVIADRAPTSVADAPAASPQVDATVPEVVVPMADVVISDVPAPPPAPVVAGRASDAAAPAPAVVTARQSTPVARDVAPAADAIVRDAPARPAADDLPLRSEPDAAWEPEAEPHVHAGHEPGPPLRFTGGLEEVEPVGVRGVGGADRELTFLAHDRERESTSSYWFPVAAALAIGIFAGFAGGFVVGQRDATPLPLSAERILSRGERAARSDESPTPTAGRAFTDADVPSAASRGRDRASQDESREAALAPGLRSQGASQGTTSRDTASGQAVPQDVTEQEVVAPEQRRANTEPRPPNPNPEQEPGTRNPEPGARESGELEVDSRPRGASVFVDGRLVGRTPLLLGDVRPGTHAVRIDLIGHRRWVTSVDVAPGSRRRVAASLER